MAETLDRLGAAAEEEGVEDVVVDVLEAGEEVVAEGTATVEILGEMTGMIAEEEVEDILTDMIAVEVEEEIVDLIRVEAAEEILIAGRNKEIMSGNVMN